MKRLTLLLTVFLMSVLAVHAQPESPLDLPQSFDTPQNDKPVILYPENGSILSTDMSFDNIYQTPVLRWTPVTNVEKYILKFVDYYTGEVIKHTVNPTYENSEGCTYSDYLGHYCTSAPVYAGWLWELKHNHTYIWRVYGKYANGVTVRSTARNLSVRLVEKPTELVPSGNHVEPLNELQWVSLPEVKAFIVVIKNLNTGTVIYRQKVSYDTSCPWYSAGQAYCAHLLPESVASKFNNGKAYSWFVKAKSYNNDTAKSMPVTYKMISGSN